MRSGSCRSLMFLALVLGLVAGRSGAEVEFVAGVDRDSVTVGDAVVLRLRVRREASDRVDVAQAVQALSGGSIEILQLRDPVTRQISDGRVEELQDVVVAAYRPGVHEIPPIGLAYRTASGDTGRVLTRPIPVTVHSVLPEGLEDIRDIKPPVRLPAKTPFWAWVVAAGLAAVAGILIWYFRRRSRRPTEAPPEPPIDWPGEVAKVLRMGLLEKGEFQDYYFRLAVVARRYLEDRTGVEAMERTTAEVGRDLEATSLDPSYITEINGFLVGADLVKFAKHRPSVKASADVADQIRSLMGRVDIHLLRAAEPPRIGEVDPQPTAL
jgi:hypothetical protein